MLRIGVLKKEYYCEKRNVTDRVNMHEKRAEYVIIKGYDLRACAGVALDKMRKKLRMKGVSPLHSNRLRDYYHPIVSPNVDVIHTCNVVCETKKPWMATFEGAFPLGQREQNLPEQRAWMQLLLPADGSTVVQAAAGVLELGGGLHPRVDAAEQLPAVRRNQQQN